MDDSVRRLAETATIHDFLPLLASRLTHERPVAIRRAKGEDRTGTWDVVFVSLSGPPGSNVTGTYALSPAIGRPLLGCCGVRIALRFPDTSTGRMGGPIGPRLRERRFQAGVSRATIARRTRT